MALHGNPRKGRQRNGYSSARPIKNSPILLNRGVWMEYVAKDAPKCAGITKRQGKNYQSVSTYCVSISR